jgi:O-antigen/teichoic acid export membrane protein
MRSSRLLRRVVRSRVAQTSGALIVSQIVLGLGGVVAARALGPAGRGVATGIVSWMVAVPAFAVLGMNTALGVRVAQKVTDLGTASVSALAFLGIVGVPVALLSALFVPPIIGGLGHDAAAVARWAVPVGVLLAMSTELLMAIAIALRRYLVFNAARMLTPLVTLIVVVAYAAAGRLTPAIVVVATLAGSAGCLVWLGSSIPWERARFDRPEFLADLRFGVTSAISGWANLVNARLDFLLMSAFVSASQLGYYGVANNVMLPVLAIPSAAATILVPRVAALLGTGDLDRDDVTLLQVRLISEVARRYLLVSLIGGAALAIAAPLVIPLLFGNSFKPAVVLIWILIPGFVGRALSAIIANAATAMRYPRVGNAAEIVAVVVTLVLLAVLLPSFAAKGAAIASTAAYLTSAVVAVIGLRRLNTGATIRTAARADAV